MITEEQIRAEARKFWNETTDYPSGKECRSEHAFCCGAKWAISQMEKRWIPVDERLPEIGTWVLVHDIYGNIDCELIAEDGDNPTKEWFKEFITHWQPLPQKPETDKNSQNK